MHNNEFVLSCFFPYQLTQLQSLISQTIAQVYLGKFELSRQQWRILATLSTQSPLSAKALGTMTNLEKMPTSRAIKGLLDQALVNKTAFKDDKRITLLSLTEKGEKLFKQIAPLVKQQEQALLSILSQQERDVLQMSIDKLTAQSKRLLDNNLHSD